MSLLERIARKVIVPILIAGNFVFANPSFSQEKKDFVPENHAVGRMGFYFDGDREVKERYGPFFSFGAGLQRNLGSGVRSEFGIDYSTTEGEKYHSRDRISIMSFLGSVNFDLGGAREHYPEKSAFVYARVGVLYNQIKEKRDSYDGKEIFGNTNGFGLIFGGGIDFIIKDKEMRELWGGEPFLEILYESVSTDKMERGGMKIIFGLKTKL